MGTNYYLAKNAPTSNSPLHIGKASAGWKFLFHEPFSYDIDDGYEIHTFDQWKKYIEDHVNVRKTHSIVDEYDDVVTPEWFFEMVESKQKEENKENFWYSVKNVNGYRFSAGEFC